MIATLALLALGWWAGGNPALLAVTLAWAGLHILFHRRYWHYVLRDMRRALRRR